MTRFAVGVIIAILAGTMIGNAAKASGIWRPHILAFISTQFQPMRMLMFPSDEVFTDEGTCESHIKKHPADITPLIVGFLGLKPEEIIHHEMTCIKDGGGQGV